MGTSPSTSAPSPISLQTADFTLPVMDVHVPTGPVGGRLQQFWPNWQAINAETWVIQVLKEGYHLPFEADPPALTRHPPDLSYKPHHPLFSELQVQVQALLDKKAVELAPATAGFYSRLFLAPKKNGEWRPVADLSPLNLYLAGQHFHMETTQSILAAMRPQKWSTSLDLKDAFLHVPIAQVHRKFLRFMVRDVHYQFRALPFGLKTSPYVFTRIVKAVGAYVRARGTQLLQYLDDWNVLTDDAQSSQVHTTHLLQLTERLGLIVNYKKSDLVPSQSFTYVGTDFNLVEARARPAIHRVEAFLQIVNSFFKGQSPPAHRWQQLLGHLTSLEKLVPRGRLHMRPIQFALSTSWNQHSDSPNCQILVTPEVVEALLWWTASDNLLRGTPLTTRDVDFRLFSDASTVGWGAHLMELRAEGVWSLEQSQLHINNLELLAVLLALEQFLPRVKNSSVMAMTDNTTVVGQITNQGGTLSRSLYNLTRSCFFGATLTV